MYQISECPERSAHRWSAPGGKAAARRMLWLGLAIWRTVTLGGPLFAVPLLFGLLNLAVAGRVVFPGGRAA